jgi:hypothetical protein
VDAKGVTRDSASRHCRRAGDALIVCSLWLRWYYCVWLGYRQLQIFMNQTRVLVEHGYAHVPRLVCSARLEPAQAIDVSKRMRGGFSWRLHDQLSFLSSPRADLFPTTGSRSVTPHKARGDPASPMRPSLLTKHLAPALELDRITCLLCGFNRQTTETRGPDCGMPAPRGIQSSLRCALWTHFAGSDTDSRRGRRVCTRRRTTP